MTEARRLSTSVPEKQDAIHLETLEAARQVAEVEIPVYKVLLRNPKIIACCLFANIGGLMYGFDHLALSLCLSMEPFQRQFGKASMTAQGISYVIPAYWQSLWNALAQLSTMFGSLIIGEVSDRFGRKASFLLSGLISFAGIAVIYTSSTSPVFLGGKMVNAFSLGMAIATAQTYIAEISPLRIRGILLSIYTFSINLGFLIASSVAFDRVAMPTESGYKVLFAVQWVWPALLVLLVWVIPESPHHLVRQGRLESASSSLTRLHNSSADIPAILQDIVSLAADEKAAAHDMQNAKYIECFKGDNWRRTRIILYANGLGQMVGVTFLANGPYFLVSAGMSATRVAMMVELGNGIGIIGNVATWISLVYFGRRQITLVAIALAALLFLPMGIAGCFPTNSSALWTVGITMQMMWFVLGPTMGPATAIAAEVSTARLRSKSQSIGFMFSYFYSTVWSVSVPYMFNVDEGNLGGKMGFIFLATAIIALVLLFFELPETKDKTFAEIDALFAQGVPARRFAGTVVDHVVRV